MRKVFLIELCFSFPASSRTLLCVHPEARWGRGLWHLHDSGEAPGRDRSISRKTWGAKLRTIVSHWRVCEPGHLCPVVIPMLRPPIFNVDPNANALVA